MKALALILILALPSCSLYRERFTFSPTDGDPGHVVDVLHVSIFQFGKAGRLSTSTQTEEFIREVNARDLETGTDGEALGTVIKGFFRP